MSDSDEMTVQVRNIQVGDCVDLEDDPIFGKTDDEEFKVHPIVEFEYCEVMEIDQESPDCIVLYFDGMAAGYDPGQIMTIRKRA